MSTPAERMASKGRLKLSKKLSLMKDHYKKAEDRAISNYKAVGFTTEVTSNYETAWREYMKSNYEIAVGPDLPDKWQKRWLKKMFGIEVV